MELPSLDPQGLIFAQVLMTIQNDILTFLGIQLAFVISLFVTSLLAQTAMILLTKASFEDSTIFLKDFVMAIPQASKRLFMTSFYVALIKVGFFFFGFMALVVPMIMISEHNVLSEVILLVLLILIVILYLYFSVVWVLSLVVSVLEECSGIEALGKARRLVKGKKSEGFFLFLFINLLSYCFFRVLSKLIVVKEHELTQEIFGLFVASFLSLMAMLEFQAYTVLYIECKKNHGEAIELQGSVEYSKVLSTPPCS